MLAFQPLDSMKPLVTLADFEAQREATKATTKAMPAAGWPDLGPIDSVQVGDPEPPMRQAEGRVIEPLGLPQAEEG